jgi:endonuclease-3 related protein
MADEYLRRIATRHGLVEGEAKTARYEHLAALTRAAFAEDSAARRTILYNEFHALTVAVGKAHCGRTARCAGCPLESDLALRS